MLFPVKQKIPNELGLYDMSGNVWEWCYDRAGWYDPKPQINPKGPDTGSKRVVRGSKTSDPTIGFRLALSSI